MNQVFESKEELEKLSGIVKRITFHSPDSGWTVLKISPFSNMQEEIAVTVYQSKVFAGATVDFYGIWTSHPKFGDQFKAVKLVEQKPASANALEKYLGSGLIKGVGPVTAKRIVKHFGKQTLEIFDNNIEALKEVPGIAEIKLETIKEAWLEHREISNVMIFLQSHGISTLFAVKIYKTYGNEAIEKVSENPYRLSEDIYGIGFFSADKIALAMRIEEDSFLRLKAAVSHVLQSAREIGHCYLTKDQILAQTTELLQLEVPELFLKTLDEMETKEELRVRLLPDSIKAYYSHSLYFDENYIAKKVKELVKFKKNYNFNKVLDWVNKFCQPRGINLSDEQAESIFSVASNGFSILTGGPGCGKTTTTKVIVAFLIALKQKVILAAPTGRAAQRMAEVIGLEAKTIHRLLEWDVSKGGFKKNEENPLEADFLILDETSMLDVHLAAAVLRAVGSSTQVLFIGDVDQLPSVGAGNILRDLIESQTIPVTRLTKVFRQAKESSIIQFAHEINKGIVPKIESPFFKPEIWQQKLDCLFIDTEEATMDQLKFIQKAKKLFQKDKNETKDNEEYQNETEFIIPPKFKHVNLDALNNAENYVQEIQEVIQNIHPWSSLHFGLSALNIIEKLYKDTIPKYFGLNAEIQILSPMTRGSLGTLSLNKLIQEKTNPPEYQKPQLKLGEKYFRIGDRIIQKRNNYDLGVFNGDIGFITDLDNEEMACTVEFPVGKETKTVIYEKDSLIEIDLAYAITIHKSQGSEFEVVIIPIFTQHFNMLFRNLIYTGLTRAKKLAVFVGSRKALAMAVRNQDTTKRQTALKYLLIS